MASIWSNSTFRNMFAGRFVTNIGDSLYFIGAMWLVHEIGGSTLYVGLAGFLLHLPQTLQFLLGPLVDQWELDSVFVYSQLIQAFVVILIPLTLLADSLSILLLLTLIPVLSMINQIIYPAQNAALPLIVEEDQLVRANTLFSMAYRSLDVLSKSIGGVLIGLFGTVALFVVDTLTFLIAALIFWMTKIPSVECTKNTHSSGDSFNRYLSDISDGFVIVKQSLLLYVAVAATIGNIALGVAFAVLPTFADSRGGPEVYGILLSAIAVGMLLGSATASLLERFPLGKLLIVLFSIGSIAWNLSIRLPSIRMMAVFIAVAWVPIGAYIVFKQTIIQNSVPTDMLGRVSSTMHSVSVISYPIGSLFGGLLGEFISATTVLTLSGVGLFGVVIVFTAHLRLRRLPATTEIGPEQMAISR